MNQARDEGGQQPAETAKAEGRSRRSRDAGQTIAQLKTATRRQLIEDGYKGLTVQGILQEAGASKGAMFHHFPSKDHLLAAAYVEMLDDSIEALNHLSDQLRRGEMSVRVFVEQIAAYLETGFFVATMEVTLGVRTNAALGEMIAEPIVAWREDMFRFWDRTFELPGKSDEEVHAHWSLALNALRGHAFTTLSGTNAAARAQFHDGFRSMFLSAATLR